MADASYWMTAQWGARIDALSVLAERLTHTVDEIQAVHPVLEAWEWGDRQEFWETEGKEGLHAFADVRKRLISAIERNAGTGDDGKPNPLNGYWLTILIDGMAPESTASLSISTNDGYSNRVTAFSNSASFKFGKRDDPSLAHTTHGGRSSS